MIRYIGILLIVLFGMVSPLRAADSSANLLILFPNLNAAYDRVFNEIVDGIKSHDDVTAHIFSLTSSSTVAEIQAQIEAEKIDALIALGQSSYDIGVMFHDQLPVIHGGMVIQPDKHSGNSGISLAGSPAKFFTQLKKIAPPVKRVFTVYSEENSAWLIRLAEQEAKKVNVELKAFAATNIREAVNLFRDILQVADGSSDAIWLVIDKVLPNQTVLPIALEAAWKKNLVLFSSNPAHTKRGALFSLFPDHKNMGYNLAELSLKQLDSPQPIVLPLSSLKISVNERTASHLGLRYSNNQRDLFDIIYPLR